MFLKEFDVQEVTFSEYNYFSVSVYSPKELFRSEEIMPYKLSSQVTRIGRSRDCQIRLPATYNRVSRVHAEIYYQQGYYYLYDRSTHGTTINGMRVQKHALRDGDRINLAGQAEFVYSRGALYSANEQQASYQTSYTDISAQPQRYHSSPPPPRSAPRAYGSGKNKTTAGLFGILLGGIGVHKFYLGESGAGVLYVLFSWTGIPTIIGLVEGIRYLSMSDAEFFRKYG